MSDLFAFLNGADGKLSWIAVAGLFIFILLALFIARKVPFLKSIAG